MIEGNVTVSFRYPVHFTTDLFSPDNALLREVVAGENNRPSRVLFVVEDEVNKHFPVVAEIREFCRRNAEFIAMAGEPILLPGGEAVKKDPEHVTTIYRAVNETGLDRHSYIAAIGGGALLDAVGFAAATAHRGIRLIRIPTTTLSQNDSGVGVKNAINYFGKKNWVGTFAPPFAVLNDFRYLTTQPNRVWREGIAEAVKVALIKDAEFFAYLEQNAQALARREMEPMEHLVARCAEMHLQHICTSGDPFEMGSSRPLDFGHWSAHKLEQMTDHRVHHGEAVAIGIALDVTYSHLKGWLTEGDWRRVLRVLSDVGFTLFTPEMAQSETLFAGLREFQEHLGGELTIQMLRHIGDGFNVHEIDYALMAESIRSLASATQPLAANVDLAGVGGMDEIAISNPNREMAVAEATH